MDNNNFQKPCIIQTAQGFSVSYKEKLLYSKYAPVKAITNTINNLTIQSGTIFLCCSPILPYGIKELLDKLPDQCFLLLCERDSALYDFTKSLFTGNDEIAKVWKEINNSQKVAFLSQNELYQLPQILNKHSYTFADGKQFSPAGSFRRIIRLDFSAGAGFNSSFYEELLQASTKALMTFWSNRVTLVKFGRKYSHNYFTNLQLLPKTIPLEKYFKSVLKPILIFGAGESINKGIEEIKEYAKDFFILCTDTSLTSLLQNNITPDGVFIEEAQELIIQAFIGTKAQIGQGKTHIFASLSSTPLISHNFYLSSISYFTTIFDDCNFISSMQKEKLLPPSNPPFGSVGLTTVYYADKFRTDDTVPIYIYGLDFSFSAGFTHAKGTMAHATRLKNTNRLNPIQNYKACYNENTRAFQDKAGNTFYTSHILQSYANTFNAYFYDKKNIFDSMDCGIKLAIPARKPDLNETESVCTGTDSNINKRNCTENSEYTNNEHTIQFLHQQTYQKDLSQKITKYIQDEKKQLETLKDILTGKIKLSEQEAEEKIRQLAEAREYLYLHFPDGQIFSTELSLLKRIRIELDYFLKLFR